jgi:peptide/nickel transport system substrate-binding protein
MVAARFVGAVFLAWLCLAPAAAAAAAGADRLILAKPSDPDTLDPHVAQSNNSLTVTCATYETLVKFKIVDGRGSTEIEPSIAESWTSSADGKVWDFAIAAGHRFSDGGPVDAAAIKFSFERLLKIAKGPNEDYPAVSAIEIVGDHTVRFKLNYDFAPFLASLATCAGDVVDPAVMAHEIDGDMGQGYLATHSMGSGAYRIASLEKGQQIVLEPNPYHGGPPRLRQIVIKIIKEASVRRLELEKGDVDLIEDLPPDQVAALKTKPGITVVDEPSFRQDYIFLNCRHPPLDQAAVRQALSYAVDYPGIIAGIQLGRAAQMRGMVPEGIWGHDPDIQQYDYDPAKARRLLAAAGIKNLRLGYLYAKADPTWETIGLVLQQNFAAIGVRLDLQEFAYSTMRDKVDRGDFDMAIGNYQPDFADPSQYLNYWVDSRLFGLAGNRAFYRNDAVDRLIREAETLSDVGRRASLYQEAQRIAVAEAPYILLLRKNYQIAMRANVMGYVYVPMLLQVFNFESMWKTG